MLLLSPWQLLLLTSFNTQLESKMKEKIDEEFSSKVDFSQEKDLFHGYACESTIV